MKIVFMGSDSIGLPTLQALKDAHDLAMVVTQPDRPAGRKRKLTPTPVGQWADDHGIECIKPENLNEASSIAEIAAVDADVIVVIAYGQWISKKVRDLARLEIINLHGSLLPRWRGAAPINWQIIDGDEHYGATIMTVVKQMDAGDMLGKVSISQDLNMTAGDLHDWMAEHGPALMLDVIAQLEDGKANYEIQDESQVTEARKLTREDSYLSLDEDALTLHRKIHGMTPAPGVAFFLIDESKTEQDPIRIKLGRVKSHVEMKHSALTGVMIKEGIFAVGEGGLEILELQPAGKKMMDWKTFNNGYQFNRPVLLPIE